MQGYTVKLGGDKRRKGESYADYKARLKLERKAIKRYLAGQTIDMADGPQSETHWLEDLGAGRRRVRKPVSNQSEG